MGQKHDQGSTCLPQTAAGQVLRSLCLAAPRTANRLWQQTHTCKQTSAKDKKLKRTGFPKGQPDSLYRRDSPWISRYHIQNSFQAVNIVIPAITEHSWV